MTNREWIETLRDDEFARALFTVCCTEQVEMCKTEVRCEQCVANWLKKEVKDFLKKERVEE